MPTYKLGQEFIRDLYGEPTISSYDYNNQNYGLEIIKADPIVDAASVEMVKDYYRIDHNDDDEQIRRNLRTSLTTIENYTNRNIITRQVTARYIRFPKLIVLPQPPHVSITSVTQIDDDGTTETLTAGTDYYTLGNQELQLQILNANTEQIQIVYEAGYGKNLNVIPTWAQDAVIYQMGIYYSNFDESMGTRVYNPETGMDQRAMDACGGNRYMRYS